jgi:hypothetical protein
MTVEEFIEMLFAASRPTHYGSGILPPEFDPVFSGRQTEGKTHMTKQAAKQTNMLTRYSSNAELENIATAAEEDAGFEKILKFVKGEYFIGEEEIPLGTDYVAHPEAWTKSWTKYVDGAVIERKMYRVAKGERPPDREDLDDLELKDTKNEDGLSADPWVFRNLLPLEIRSSGEFIVFSSPSVGGERGVAELCKIYARRVQKFGSGQPIIKLATVPMPTRYKTKVPRPKFDIVGWDQEEPGGNVVNLAPRDSIPPATSEDDFGDAIPDFDK